MAALTNAAAVKIWSQKPTLLARLFQESAIQRLRRDLRHVRRRRWRTRPHHAPQRSARDSAEHYLPEFHFHRISLSVLEQLPSGCLARSRREGYELQAVRGLGRQGVQRRRGSYELWDGLGFLATGRGGGDQDRAPTVHASTLNSLIGGGKTRRATRTSTRFGESREARVSVIPGERAPRQVHGNGPVGNHTACTNERFVICIDHATQRHAALPAGSRLPSGVSEWTWLPLTPQQARGLSAGWRCWTRRQLHRPRTWRGTTQRARRRQHLLRLAPSWAPPGGYKLPDGEESRLRYMRVTSPSGGAAQVRTEFRISNRRDLHQKEWQLFATKAHATLPFEDRGAQGHDGQPGGREHPRGAARG